MSFLCPCCPFKADLHEVSAHFETHTPQEKSRVFRATKNLERLHKAQTKVTKRFNHMKEVMEKVLRDTDPSTMKPHTWYKEQHHAVRQAMYDLSQSVMRYNQLLKK